MFNNFDFVLLCFTVAYAMLDTQAYRLLTIARSTYSAVKLTECRRFRP